MNGKYLLDTNIVIAIFADEAVVRQKLAGAGEVFVPSIVLGELYYGAQKSARIASNVARVDEFASDNIVLVCDTETARHYGEIKSELRAKGRPIPENDIWIAAIAKQHQLTLVTRDGHFNNVDRLLIEVW
jgi:tRNA(fMet)-specific endonuclease VapC